MRTLVYGRVCIQSEMCPVCQREAFVFSNVMSCCGLRIEGKPKGWKRMTDCAGKRVRLGHRERLAIIAKQNGRCIYCSIPFATPIYRHAKRVRKTIEFDHFVPYSYAGNGHRDNIVAACSICNRIKSWFMFNNLDECIQYIDGQWKVKRYTAEKPTLGLSELRDAV